MSRRAWYIALGIAGVAVAAYVGVRVKDHYDNPARVAYMLNIAEPPQSLHVLDCESGPVTDVVITCAIEIAPRDFPLLLAGYSFAETRISASSYSVGFQKVGGEFPVAVKYQAQPKSFKHGGFVTVLADQERTRALVDLYIE